MIKALGQTVGTILWPHQLSIPTSLQTKSPGLWQGRELDQTSWIHPASLLVLPIHLQACICELSHTHIIRVFSCSLWYTRWTSVLRTKVSGLPNSWWSGQVWFLNCSWGPTLEELQCPKNNPSKCEHLRGFWLKSTVDFYHRMTNGFR